MARAQDSPLLIFQDDESTHRLPHNDMNDKLVSLKVCCSNMTSLARPMQRRWRLCKTRYVLLCFTHWAFASDTHWMQKIDKDVLTCQAVSYTQIFTGCLYWIAKDTLLCYITARSASAWHQQLGGAKGKAEHSPAEAWELHSCTWGREGSPCSTAQGWDWGSPEAAAWVEDEGVRVTDDTWAQVGGNESCLGSSVKLQQGSRPHSRATAFQIHDWYADLLPDSDHPLHFTAAGEPSHRAFLLNLLLSNA